MTLRERVAMIEPQAINDRACGGVTGCPFNYTYLNVTDGKTGIFAFCPFPDGDVCISCWNREYVEDNIDEGG